jgi:hypothetical protein
MSRTGQLVSLIVAWAMLLAAVTAADPADVGCCDSCQTVACDQMDHHPGALSHACATVCPYVAGGQMADRSQIRLSGQAAYFVRCDVLTGMAPPPELHPPRV